MSDNAVQETQAPTPDPALRRLDRLVGTWTLKGHLIGSDEENITGEISFQWLEGGFFLQQDAEIHFAGMFEVKSRELIGYDPETERFASLRLLELLARAASLQVGSSGRHPDDLRVPRSARFKLQRRVQRRRGELLGRLAAEPGR
jgi:hypothetical protein